MELGELLGRALDEPLAVGVLDGVEGGGDRLCDAPRVGVCDMLGDALIDAEVDAEHDAVGDDDGETVGDDDDGGRSTLTADEPNSVNHTWLLTVSATATL